jgi:hypothetical protein
MNFIRKASVAIRGNAGSAGIWIQKFAQSAQTKAGRLFIDRKGGTPEPLSLDRVNVLGTSVAAITLDGTDDGVTVVANNSAATVVATLPKVATVGAGYRARLLAAVLPGAGAGTTLTPNAADKFQGNGFNAKTAGQTLVNSAATDAVGDYVDVVSDGGTIWYVINKVGTWA